MSRASVARMMFFCACVFFFRWCLKQRRRANVRNWKENSPDKVKQQKRGKARERRKGCEQRKRTEYIYGVLCCERLKKSGFDGCKSRHDAYNVKRKGYWERKTVWDTSTKKKSKRVRIAGHVSFKLRYRGCSNTKYKYFTSLTGRSTLL